MRQSVFPVGLLGTLLAIGLSANAQTPAAPPDAAHHVKVFKQATCGCCKQWIAHMTHAGFVVDAEDVADLAPVKVVHQVPPALRTCHTAIVDGYVVEGHVPADVIETLLRDRPAVAGIGVAGMPKGSPGMESPTPQPYQVLAFRDGQITGVFAAR